MKRRKPLRLMEYDYAQAGAYFVTICAWRRECLFGEVVAGAIQLNEAGKIVEREWLRTAVVRPNVTFDAFVVMPNHVHGIIVLNDPTMVDASKSRPKGPRSGSLGAIVGQWKSIVTKQINAGRHTPGHAVWQRNYYEHIIRNEGELHAIRRYIEDNPLGWESDRNHPAQPITA